MMYSNYSVGRRNTHRFDAKDMGMFVESTNICHYRVNALSDGDPSQHKALALCVILFETAIVDCMRCRVVWKVFRVTNTESFCVGCSGE